RVVECGNFQNAEAFLLRNAGAEHNQASDTATGQRGRQRAILREGVYAINLALFFVITEDRVYALNVDGKAELAQLVGWQNELREVNGFNPVVIGEEMSAVDPLDPSKRISVDSIGIV